MRLVPVTVIPYRGEEGRGEDTAFASPYYKTYRSLLEAFETSPGPHARVMADLDPATLYRSLRTTVRRLGLVDSVDVIKRGRAVYLDRIDETERERRAGVAESLETALHIFSVDEEHERVRVPLPEGLTPEQAYHSLHYRRTKNGYGNVRVIREGDEIYLVKRVDI